MKFPKQKPFRSEKYLKWVRSLPCAYCERPGEHAHHLIARGNMGGMGKKAPDSMTISLCAYCHDIVHRGTDKAMLDSQWEMIARTLGRAIDEGVVKV